MSDRQFSPASGCLGKQRFEAAAVANKALHRVKRRKPGGNGDVLRAYVCPRCSGWHLGHTHRSRVS